MDGQGISIVISVAALTVSAIVAWATLFWRGTVRMTRPSLIAFLPRSVADREKIFLRSLLYGTSKRGNVIETMHVRVSRSNSAQNFDFWGYGDTSLVLGSGLYVGEQGCVYYHHFVLRDEFPDYSFRAGNYDIEIYATLANSVRPLLMSRQRVSVSLEHSNEINVRGTPLHFFWDPELSKYQPRVDKGTDANLLELLRSASPVCP